MRFANVAKSQAAAEAAAAVASEEAPPARYASRGRYTTGPLNPSATIVPAVKNRSDVEYATAMWSRFGQRTGIVLSLITIVRGYHIMDFIDGVRAARGPCTLAQLCTARSEPRPHRPPCAVACYAGERR